jgi:methylated-DNA-protein-cysteine methyltransferase-like protein
MQGQADVSKLVVGGFEGVHGLRQHRRHGVIQSPQLPLAAAVAQVLRATEPGELLTYGEVAALAGLVGGARAVGNVLARSHGLPWWRVVNSRGRLAPGKEARQGQLLADEGIEVRDGRCRQAGTAAPCQPA